MEESKKRRLRRTLIIIGAALIAAAGIAAGLLIYSQQQADKIPEMTWKECIDYTISEDNNINITVGTIRNGEASWEVYSKADMVETIPYVYEAGSITKTFTAALVEREVQNGRLSLDGNPGDYLDLPQKYYPSLRSILTHTSGYSSYYLESPMTGNFFAGRNSFCGIGDSMVLDRLGSTDISQEAHGFDYSNFGYAALGLILEKTTGTEFTTLMNDFTASLGLENTHISDGTGDLGDYWDWQLGDTYLAAGGLVTDINDMLKYAQLQLDGTEPFAACHESQCVIDAAPESYKKMGIYMDEIGLSWIIDRENGIIWHNGGTGHYNSYLGFSPEKQCAVVVLSNTAPSYRIPVTVIGSKLLRELCGE